jgi:hypothetical protein
MVEMSLRGQSRDPDKDVVVDVPRNCNPAYNRPKVMVLPPTRSSYYQKTLDGPQGVAYNFGGGSAVLSSRKIWEQVSKIVLGEQFPEGFRRLGR